MKNIHYVGNIKNYEYNQVRLEQINEEIEVLKNYPAAKKVLDLLIEKEELLSNCPKMNIKRGTRKYNRSECKYIKVLVNKIREYTRTKEGFKMMVLYDEKKALLENSSHLGNKEMIYDESLSSQLVKMLSL
jgi:hypothetical protein